MNVPFWQPGKTYKYYKTEILGAIDRIASGGELVAGNMGHDIARFEKRFAEFLGVKHFILTGSGTQSLFLAYKALGIGPGDEVITVSHTFVATIDQIKAVGATPVLVDIGEDGLIDPTEIEKAITPKTKAIVPVHLEGKVCDMPQIATMLSKIFVETGQHISIIEDACQAVGASQAVSFHDIGITGYKRFAGSWNVGCFSFYPAKILGSLGNLGGVATNDDVLAEKVRNMSSSYRFAPLEKRGWGYNLEPDNLQAAIANVKLDHLSEILARRKEIAEKYLEAFKDLPLILPPNQDGRVWQDFVLRVPERKEEFCSYLKENGVGILGHDLVGNHTYPLLGFSVSLPKTEKYIAEQVRIPCTPDHTDDDIDYVIRVIREFYGK